MHDHFCGVIGYDVDAVFGGNGVEFLRLFWCAFAWYWRIDWCIAHEVVLCASRSPRDFDVY